MEDSKMNTNQNECNRISVNEVLTFICNANKTQRRAIELALNQNKNRIGSRKGLNIRKEVLNEN